MSLSPSLSPLGTTNLFSMSCESVSVLYIHSFVLFFVIVVQLWSCVWHCVTPWTAPCQASLSITSSQIFLKHTSIKLVMRSNHLIICHPLLLLISIFPSIRVFYNESILYIRWPKYAVPVLASVLPMNIQEWFPLGLTGWIYLQSKGLSRVFSNTTIQKHQFFGAQLSLWSNSRIHTGLLEKNIPLNIQTSVGKVVSLLFNILSRLIIAFLPRSKCLLISWLLSSSAVILEPKKIKSVIVSTVSPSISHEVMEPDAMIFSF